MKKSDIYEIALKVLGIYVVFRMIDQFREILAYISIWNQISSDNYNYGEIDERYYVLIIIGSFIFVLGFAWYLLFRTKHLTKLISKPEDFEETVALRWDTATVYRVSLTLAGVLSIVLIAPELCIKFIQHVQMVQSQPIYVSPYKDFLIISSVKVIAGILLLVYAGPLSNFLVKKVDGKEEEEDEDEDGEELRFVR